jgi:hypothetical protein
LMATIVPSNYNEYSGYDRVSNSSLRKHLEQPDQAGVDVPDLVPP